MMKRLLALSVLSAAVATAGFASSASAMWTFSPAGPVTLSSPIDPGTGSPIPLQLFKGIPVSCNISGSGNIASGLASVTSLSLVPGSFFCFAISFAGLPYDLEPAGGVSLTSVTLKDVTVTAITGNCRGDLTGDFDQATGIITFNGATIPSDPPGGADCVVTGPVATSPAISYTIP
ncbi:hypothetical protein FKG94_12785 [Exilibacterium tricleocarpae]|uniref:Protein activator of alkane oxidation PraB n=1 Tax=Exilibacterium tricleocarpae TaxID=2591008 RepID=A0A545TNU0_9GAMM|nr:hypothetical protein [Exilibacterium tricleocarpae]TQV78889.1 hypothetical protein FKG94_12785 [Exilibacterium tricleocarpae]